MKKEDLQRWFSFLEGELYVVRNALRERGGKFFMRPFLVGGLGIFAAYWYVYLPPAGRLVEIEEELSAAEVSSQYAGDYKSLKARLDGLYERLPRTRNPETWLLTAVRRTLRQEGIVPLSTSAPAETVRENYRFISISVRCQASYPQIASWISRLERGQELLFIKSLTLDKDAKPIGSNTANVTITTVVPREGP
ncbi:MAG: GspMb/PilO family protein [Elusimicrobiota bacterium]